MPLRRLVGHTHNNGAGLSASAIVFLEGLKLYGELTRKGVSHYSVADTTFEISASSHCYVLSVPLKR